MTTRSRKQIKQIITLKRLTLYTYLLDKVAGGKCVSQLNIIIITIVPSQDVKEVTGRRKES